MVAWYCILQNKTLNTNYSSLAHDIYYKNKQKVYCKDNLGMLWLPEGAH
jgi:hypothetical protein